MMCAAVQGEDPEKEEEEGESGGTASPGVRPASFRSLGLAPARMSSLAIGKSHAPHA